MQLTEGDFVLIGGTPAGVLTEVNDLFVVIGVGGYRPTDDWQYRVVSRQTVERALRMHVVHVSSVHPPGHLFG